MSAKPVGRLPGRLRGATSIGVYSPSGSFSDTPEKTALFARGVAKLTELGFAVCESQNCRSSWYHAAATPELRAADLRELLHHPEVDIILPSIGGHVAAQLLPLLDFDEIAASDKALFGFSDNAIIPLVTTSLTGLYTFHSLCDVTFGFGRFTPADYSTTQASFMNTVRDGAFALEGQGQWRPLQRGEGSGVLLGGNLTGLVSLIGTRWWPNWRGRIMYWESADSLHNVIAHLIHLGHAGAFDHLAGMIIGRASTLREDFYRREQVLPIDLVLLDVLGCRGRFPIAIEADIGHDVENVTIPNGAVVTLRVSDVVGCAFATA